jgi:hypothetical protein
MNKHISRLALFFILLIPNISFADDTPKAVQENLQSAGLVGSARQTALFFNIYDVSLYAPNGKYTENKPHALSITYLRYLSGEDIASRSIDEMKAQGFEDEEKLDSWHKQMAEIFPDVYEGTNLTGVVNQKGETLFFKNDELIGKVSDHDFSKHFFGIWLSPKTTEPKLRSELLRIES